MEPFFIFIILGSIVGTVSGLFGIGGGVIMVPAYLFAFKGLGISSDYAVLMATRTSLATILLTSLYSAWNHHKIEPLNKVYLRELSLFVIIGTILGSFIVTGLSPKVLELALLTYVSLIGLKMWFGFKVKENAGQSTFWTNLIVGNIIGLKSAILGIGGGTISIPYLTWRQVPMAQAVGISAFIGFIISLTSTGQTLVTNFNESAGQNWTYGLIYFPAVIGTLSTSLIFSKIGAHYAHKIPQQKLRRVFAVILLAIATRGILKLTLS